MVSVVGVLMAAGLSTRMGQPKQLARLAGMALCRHAALALAGAGHTSLLAVIPAGAVGAGIRAALADLPFEFVEHPDPARGLLSSFKLAVAALPDGIDAANFALADMPYLTAAVHSALLDTFALSRPPLVLAEYGPDAVRAPPHLFRADLLPEILTLPDSDHGPRALIKKYAADAPSLRLSAELLLDIDTPAALAEAEQRRPF